MSILSWFLSTVANWSNIPFCLPIDNPSIGVAYKNSPSINEN